MKLFLLMGVVAAALLLGLEALGVNDWLAVFIAILAAVSLERTSYVRQWLDRTRP
jgi:hypothetical protein